jgi:hypothetical protein
MRWNAEESMVRPSNFNPADDANTWRSRSNTMNRANLRRKRTRREKMERIEQEEIGFFE